MYDIKYNLPITKKDEWKEENEFGLTLVSFNYNKVEVFWIGHKRNHLYYIDDSLEGIRIVHDPDYNFTNNNRPYGYYRENK